MDVPMFKMLLIAALFLPLVATAGPQAQMTGAFIALTELVPYLADKKEFADPKNAPFITKKISDLKDSFKASKHDKVLKTDLFAPSYALINADLPVTLEAFKAGRTDFAQWRLREVSSHCIDCHGRLPTTFPSSFQNGSIAIDKSKYKDVYSLGIAQLIVRRYADAKDSFTRSIEDKILRKEFDSLELPLKQLLMIDAKILKAPGNSLAILNHYSIRKDLPQALMKDMASWTKSLKLWQTSPLLKSGLTKDAEAAALITNSLEPLLLKNIILEEHSVDLLFASGLLSNYLYAHPLSAKAPELNYWIGWCEKYLKRDSFFDSGDLFLKQCVRRYSDHPIAKKCLDEYKDSVMFNFTGTSGTYIPNDVKKELKELEDLI